MPVSKRSIFFLFILLECTSAPIFGVESEVAEPLSAMSDDNRSDKWNIDRFQNYWSRKLLLFSSNLDKKLSDNFSSDDNISAPLPYRDTKINKEGAQETYRTSIGLDEFFKDTTFLDTTNRSYIKLSGGYMADKLGDSSPFYKITARIKLPKTQEKFQLYIGDDTQEIAKLPNGQYDSINQGIGLKYFIPSFFNRLYSSASIGITSIDKPYAATRIEYPFFAGDWLVKAMQNFKLSRENKFEEWTTLYFDHKIDEHELFRILFQRSTKSDAVGMDYLSQISYMNTHKNGIGFNHYIAMNGRTKDLTGTAYANGTTPQEGVYEYSAGTIWRQQIFRNYLFYQLQPIVSFHEQYGYRTDYIFRMSLDFYFGNHLY